LKLRKRKNVTAAINKSTVAWIPHRELSCRVVDDVEDDDPFLLLVLLKRFVELREIFIIMIYEDV